MPGLMGLAVLVPHILVPAREFERARALLVAAPDPSFEGAQVEGTCPVHEKPAVGTCDRCGFEARQHQDASAGTDRFVKTVVAVRIGLMAFLG